MSTQPHWRVALLVSERWMAVQAVYAEFHLLLQLMFASLGENRLSGTLPSSWTSLTQASHATNESPCSIQFALAAM